MKKCFVPLCQNTSVNSPNKIFVFVPVKQDIRKLWCDAVGYKKVINASVHRNCCEDHFNLEEDAANFMQFKLLRNCRLRIKKGVVPSKYIKKVNDDVDFTQAPRSLSFQTKSPTKRVLLDNNCDNVDEAKIEITVNEGSSSPRSLEASSEPHNRSPTNYFQSSEECYSFPSKHSEASTLSNSSYRRDEIKQISQDRILFLMKTESTEADKNLEKPSEIKTEIEDSPDNSEVYTMRVDLETVTKFEEVTIKTEEINTYEYEEFIN